ncbi:MAG: methyltransferase type 11, partial [Actinomycetota bacterium]|nr:methyltransferase type 11 [Actinomycetota bacterium]
AISSSVGVIFAPRQQVAADELARVCAPGGRIALSAWRPEDSIGSFFQFMRQYQPPMPEGIGNPLDWGRPDHATALLGESFNLEFASLNSPLVLDSGEAFWDLMSRAFGPTRTLAAAMDEQARAEFRQSFIEMAETDRDGEVIRQSRPYTLIKGQRF